MYVIIDWRSHYANQHQNEAIAFFKEMEKTYSKVNNVIYEIWNEPKDVTWKDNIKPYALTVIKAIRAIDKKNLIVVGTSTYSQDVDVAAADPITGYKNIAYVLHFHSGTHHQDLRNQASSALKKSIALLVTHTKAVPGLVL
ncbi:endoglucanase Z-like [Belonocnema kinseyi]|uniref:endoglucanase Z-like n=1 Tax=Belonocnema kinseyi TaxID=2817044 RepID=UPI00143D82B4|nr:endoglucanase Z-like [Belonocnema kinseyi]